MNEVIHRVDDEDVVAVAAAHVVARNAVGAAVQQVVAVAAVHVVVSGQAAQRVAAAVAVDDVGHRVAGTVDVAHAGQREVLDIDVRERESHRQVDPVDAPHETVLLVNEVIHRVDDEDVVAVAAAHVVARNAVGAAVHRLLPSPPCMLSSPPRPRSVLLPLLP